MARCRSLRSHTIVSCVAFVGLLSGVMTAGAVAQVVSHDPDYVASLLASGLNGPANGVVHRAATNDALVSVFFSGTVTSFDDSTGAASLFASVPKADEMDVNSAGEVWVNSHDTGKPIYRFDSGGALLGTFSPFAAHSGNPFAQHSGIAFDDADNALVLEHSTFLVWFFAAGTYASPTLYASGFVGIIDGIAWDPTRHRLFVADMYGGSVYEATPGGTLLSDHTLWASGLIDPQNFAFDPFTDDVFISSNDTIARVVTAGGPVTTFASGFTSERSGGASDLDFDSAGNLYADDKRAGTLWKFARAGDEVQCRAGNVNMGVGLVSDVLFVNGSSGAPTFRQVDVTAGASVLVSVSSPPAGGANHYALWIYDGEPNPESVTPLEYKNRAGNIFNLGTGCRCLPVNNSVTPGSCACPVSFPTGRTSKSLSIATAAKYCLNLRPGFPRAPTSFNLVFLAGKHTIGGLIYDNGSPNAPLRVSIMNSVIVNAL